MTLVETMIQAINRFRTRACSLHGQPRRMVTGSLHHLNIRAGEMLLPWWGFPPFCRAHRAHYRGFDPRGSASVAISPLGVSRRGGFERSEYWRAIGVVVVFPALVVSMKVLMAGQRRETSSSQAFFFMLLFLSYPSPARCSFRWQRVQLFVQSAPPNSWEHGECLTIHVPHGEMSSAISLMALLSFSGRLRNFDRLRRKWT